jgi:hypothetical protein
MKHIVTFMLLLLAAWSVGAADFYADAPTGQRLYYGITSANSVQVVAPLAGVSWAGYDTPEGRLVIPATVTHEGTTYNVTAVGNSAFNGCYGLTSVTLGANIVSLGTNAFAMDTMLTSFFGSASALQRVGMMAFYTCTRLDTIELPQTITEISTAAFNNCGYFNDIDNWGDERILYVGPYVISVLSSDSGDVVIADGTLGLANAAFYNCHLVERATLPASLRFIGSHCFQDCFALDTIRLLGTTPPTINIDIFFSIDPCIVAVPCNALSAYQAAPLWSDYPLVEDTCATPHDTTGIATISNLDKAFSISPNPASTHATLCFDPIAVADGGTIMLLDIGGRLLQEYRIDRPTLDIDLSHHAAGTYLLRLVTPHGTGVSRLAVVR